MKNNHTGKILAIGIIVLFIGVGVVSSANSVKSNENDDLEGNIDIDALDNPVEVISFFRGSCESVNIKGFVYNKPIEIYTGFWGLYISGIKQLNSGLLDIFFEINPDNYVKASRFIGIVYESDPDRHYLVYGIAFGDIEWS